MNKDFVSYDLAVKLKKKGFRNKCLAYYLNNDLVFNVCNFRGAGVENLLTSYNSLSDVDNIYDAYKYMVDAPTIDQVLKWLREEKRLHIEIGIWDRKYFPAIVHIYIPDENIVHCSQSTFLDDENTFDSYEEAVLASIEYVLKNLI